MKSETTAAAAILIVGLALAGASGCASAEAQPLEVTYYYLPG